MKKQFIIQIEFLLKAYFIQHMYKTPDEFTTIEKLNIRMDKSSNDFINDSHHDLSSQLHPDHISCTANLYEKL